MKSCPVDRGWGEGSLYRYENAVEKENILYTTVDETLGWHRGMNDILTLGILGILRSV